ncbi:hypothetical protein KSE_04990 [Kitasatospora setae KM-6054]|uniref:Uncharacterized protein n=1 Tax=Kitasatospora setae (strain ATCC 33774 / DSM 43861 / JCM 3304 / KCC A-0304 / NBRC 14216 / KM-6054) TaxID=452652 RepID=E4N564_KITSK|nr:hypothetical protein KSE_04990 [Kitasatospora setae KM-6054]
MRPPPQDGPTTPRGEEPADRPSPRSAPAPTATARYRCGTRLRRCRPVPAPAPRPTSRYAPGAGRKEPARCPRGPGAHGTRPGFRAYRGRTWSRQDFVLGFAGDVGDLAKLTQAADGIRCGSASGDPELLERGLRTMARLRTATKDPTAPRAATGSEGTA